MDVGNRYHTFDFVKVKSKTNLATLLLGLPSCIELGLVNRADAITDDIAKQHTDVFVALAGCPVNMPYS